MLNFKKLFRSFRFALKGLKYAFKNEQNFRVEILIGLLVVIFMFVFQVKIWEAIMLIFLISSVLVLELINTIFEKIADILKPRMHVYVEIIKDMMSAAVLISALGAAVIGLLIFIPYLLDFF